MSLLDILPSFPTAYISQNRQAIDWSFDNFVAYATGCQLHLSHIENQRIQRLYSIDAPYSPITCCRFHPKLRSIAMGDESGRVHLWDIDARKFIAYARPLYLNDSVLSIAFHNEDLLVLLKSKKMVSLTFTHNRQTNTHWKSFTENWVLQMPHMYTSFSIDPHFSSYLLFSGTQNRFSIYKFSSTGYPKPYFDTIELSTGDDIHHAEWSYHLPSYIFLVLSGEVLYFEMESRSIIPLVTQRATSSSFSFIVQDRSDYSQILVYHKSGGISVYKTNSTSSYYLKKEVQPKYISGQIAGFVTSPAADGIVAVVYANIGLALLDFERMTIIAVDPLVPAAVSTFDSDGVHYTLGTKTGEVMFGHLISHKDLRRFKVGEEAVEFVGFDKVLGRVYYQTRTQMGVVDLTDCSVHPFKSRATEMVRCFGSRKGSIIAQRDDAVLGVFINGKEHPLILPQPLVDLSIDESVSNQSSGTFCALLKNQEVRFFEYSTAKGVVYVTGLKPRGIDSEALCFAVGGSLIVTGFANGVLLFFDREKKTVASIQTNLTRLRKLRFARTTLYGMGDDGALFRYDSELIACPYQILDYQLVSEQLLMVKNPDGVVRFVQPEGWKTLQITSRYLPAPTQNELLERYINHHKEGQAFSPVAADLWRVLIGRPTMRMQALAGIGEKGQFERVNCELLSKVPEVTPGFLMHRIISLLFADRFADAATLLSAVDDTDNNYFLYTFICSTLLCLESDDNVNLPQIERARVHLKSAAVTMASKGKLSEATLLFRTGRMDKQAVETLLDAGEEKLAIRFASGCLNESDRERALFKIGVRLVQEGKFKEAALFFAGANEYHAVLFVLLSLGCITDAYYIMIYLEEHGKLSGLSKDNLRLYPDIEPINSLVQLIKGQFELLQEKLNK